jgi:hypothetical protein
MPLTITNEIPAHHTEPMTDPQRHSMRGPLFFRPTHEQMLLAYELHGRQGMTQMMSKGGPCNGQTTLISQPFYLIEPKHHHNTISVELRWRRDYGFGLFVRAHETSRDSKKHPGRIVTRFQHSDIQEAKAALLLRHPQNGGRCVISITEHQHSVKPAAVTHISDMAWLINTACYRSSGTSKRQQNNCRLAAASLHQGKLYSSIFLTRNVQPGQQLLLAYSSQYMNSINATADHESTPANFTPNESVDQSTQQDTATNPISIAKVNKGGRPRKHWKHQPRDKKGIFCALPSSQ